jgi:hypothetical protein
MFKLNLTNYFQTFLLSTFIVPKFIKFCNHEPHYKLKEKHHAFIILFSIILNVLHVKNYTIF